MKNLLLLTTLYCVALAASKPLEKRASPQVILNYGTFQGVADSGTGTNSFLGMPFAKAGRFENPTVIGPGDKLQGVQDATKYGDACPQQELTASPLDAQNAEVGKLLTAIELLIGGNITQQSEDCLTINVQVPQGIKSNAKLPVLMWIHGGGFELGASGALGLETTAVPGVIYQGANIVARSVQMKQPVIFVSANHRLNGFGTLASKETKAAGIGNLLLKDQRVAMQWVQNYISRFGGDPKKVTLFGESAGSQAIATHMVLNNGNPAGLFRAAIMMSGGPSRFSDYRRGQATFDFIASAVGCGSSADKLGCLKQAPYNSLYEAVNEIPNFFSYLSTAVPWYPRPDGGFLRLSPHELLHMGEIASVPFIIGDMKDEGTIFSLANQFNITTDQEFRNYFKTVFFPSATTAQINHLADLYPQNPAAGSPFDTGARNALTPQYKRLAALIGDTTFQTARRDLLNYRAGKQPAWTYLIEDSIPLLGQSPILDGLRATDFPAVGSFHVSDVTLYAFGTVPATLSRNTLNIMSTFIAFANSLDPNTHGLLGLPHWPQYNTASRPMFRYKESGPDIIADNYRAAAFEYINSNADAFLF